jgi:hypothetical protein
MYILFTKNREIFKSFIVFPNNTKLWTTNKKVVHLKNLCKKIEEEQQHILSYDEVRKICEKIESRNIYSKENIRKHHNRVNKKYVS